MTNQQALHLHTWAEVHLRDDERDEAINAILAFLVDYPDMLDRSWREVLDLARRYRDGIKVKL